MEMMGSVCYRFGLYESEMIDEYAAEYHEEQLHVMYTFK